MYSVQNRVGKLVEIRIWSPVSVAEASDWQRDHDAVVASVRGGYACFVDLVDATVFPPDAVDAYVATMRNEPRLRRTATLLPTSATMGLQIERMIREAGNAERCTFRALLPLGMWLGEALDVAERARLGELLTEHESRGYGRPCSTPDRGRAPGLGGRRPGPERGGDRPPPSLGALAREVPSVKPPARAQWDQAAGRAAEWRDAPGSRHGRESMRPLRSRARGRRACASPSGLPRPA